MCCLGKAEKLLWTTCAELARLGIPAFPFAGTLLGLVRNGCLLDFDKDLDIAVWMESWDACCSALEEAGWARSPMRIEYSNYRDYVHPELGVHWMSVVCRIMEITASSVVFRCLVMRRNISGYRFSSI